MSLTIIGASSQRPVQTNVANTWTADQTFNVIKAQHCDAATSAGVHIGNLTHQDVAIFGAGGGQGSTFYGQINGTSLVLSGAASCTTLTASGAISANFESDSVLTGRFLGGYLGYTGLRQGATTHDLYFDVYNGGTLLNALRIQQNGAATFASSVSCAGLTSTVAGVAATFDSGAASDARMEFKRNNVRQGLFSWDTSVLRFEGDATASSAIYFKTGGGDRLTIASGGTVTVTSTNDGSLTCAGRITAKVAVPGSFADLAAVQSYLVSILT